MDLANGVQEAVALQGVGTIASTSGQTPMPIASLTKVMSAMVVLHDHPLVLGQNGPLITITASDVARYKVEKAQGDSVVKIRAGETLSELQALEAMLIPSGDNITQLLALWDAGSEANFVAQMNALAKSLGLHETTYAGTSGVDPATMSTASNQLRLGEVAMSNPVFASIVALAQVTLPVAGVVYNVNAELGTDGIDGVKTGWLPQSGGCIVVAASNTVHHVNANVVGVILGQEGIAPIPSALTAARKLVVAVDKRLRRDRLRAGSTVATYDASDGQVVPLVTASPLHLVGWSGALVHVRVWLTRPVGLYQSAGSLVGEVEWSLGAEHTRSALKMTASLTNNSLRWRFTHL
jgi:D-alanyl-D-alanine carboxypeptidase (penicillin-binding protein 5/6)